MSLSDDDVEELQRIVQARKDFEPDELRKYPQASTEQRADTLDAAQDMLADETTTTVTAVRVAEQTGLSTRQAGQALAALADAGELERIYGKNRYRYTL